MRSFSTNSGKDFNDGIRSAKSIWTKRIVYKSVGSKTAYLKCYADASFAPSEVLSLQIGYTIMLCIEKRCCNTSNYDSRKSHGIIWSATAADVYAFVEVFDAGYLIAKDLKQTHWR